MVQSKNTLSHQSIENGTKGQTAVTHNKYKHRYESGEHQSYFKKFSQTSLAETRDVHRD